MPKQYRVIRRTELIDSYIIEVPDEHLSDGHPLDEFFEGTDWEDHILGCVYENDVGDSGSLMALTLKKPVTFEDPLFFNLSNDDEVIWELEEA